MRFSTRWPTDPTLDDVIGEALREDLRVKLTSNDGTLTLVIDGTDMASISWESFSLPLARYGVEGDAATLADDLIAKKRRRRFRNRMRALRTETQLAAEGGELPVRRTEA